MGVEKYLIAPTVNLGIAQRLLRKLCKKCKIKSKPNIGEQRIIEQAIRKMPIVYKKELPNSTDTIFRPSEKGCDECNGKAYKGRIAIFEVLEMTDQLEQIILTDISEAKIRAEGRRQGMISMFEDGIIKVLQGITSLEELLVVAQEQQEEADL